LRIIFFIHLIINKRQMKPNEEEINEVINQCVESEEEGASRWPGMTYEQGVKAAIEWLQGYGENPMQD